MWRSGACHAPNLPGTRINVGLTFIEAGGLALIIVIALGALFSGDAEPSRALESPRTRR
jgi:hypothetical protein